MTTCYIDDTDSLLAERDKLREINADLVAALNNAANVLAGLAVGDLKSINRDSPAIARARAALARAKGE